MQTKGKFVHIASFDYKTTEEFCLKHGMKRSLPVKFHDANSKHSAIIGLKPLCMFFNRISFKAIVKEQEKLKP